MLGKDCGEHEDEDQLMYDWGVPIGYVARCSVLLGYREGDYPAQKPRIPGRVNIIDPEE